MNKLIKKLSFKAIPIHEGTSVKMFKTYDFVYMIESIQEPFLMQLSILNDDKEIEVFKETDFDGIISQIEDFYYEFDLSL